MSATLSVNGQEMTMDRLIATIQKYGGKNVALPQVPPNNIYAFLPTGTLVDNTGGTDVSSLIKTAHDAAQAAGWRTMWFPVGTYYAPTLSAVADVIFVGPGVLTGAYRKFVFPEGTRPSELLYGDVCSSHRRRFDQAVAAATPSQPAVIVLMGDSTTEAGSCIDILGRQENIIRRRLRETYGAQADNIVVLNYGIGGTTWGTANSNPMPSGFSVHTWQTDLTKPWTYFVINPMVNGVIMSPDLVIFNFGQNDTSNFDLTQMQGVVATVLGGSAKRFGLPPDLWFQTPYAPSLMCGLAQATMAGQEGRDYVAGYTRTYAQKYGYGLIDVGRTAAVARDGFDIRTTRFTQFFSQQNVSLPFTFPKQVWDFDFDFRVPGNSATDLWAYGSVVVQLSSKAGNVAILEADSATGFLAVTVMAATGIVSVPRTVTTQPVNYVGMPLGFSARGGQISVRAGGYNGNFWTERHGGLFTPSITMSLGAPPAQVSMTACEGIPIFSVPFLLDSEQFGAVTPGAQIPNTLLPDGGNSINHQEAIGMETVTGRTYNATKFG
jgi:hypothetical protein